MKKILAALLLIAGCSAGAFFQDFKPAAFSLNSSDPIGPNPANYMSIVGLGLDNLSFSWSTVGTVSAGACALQGGSTTSSFGTTIIAAQTVTTSDGPTALATGITSNYIRINCTTPIVGSGQVTFRIFGWVISPSSFSGAVTIADGGSVTLGSIADAASTAGGTGTISAKERLMTTQLDAIKTAVESTSPVATTDPCSSATPATPIYPAGSDNHQTVITGTKVLCNLSAFSIHTAAQFIRVYDAATGFNGCNSATGLKWSGIIPGASTGAGFTGVNFPGGLAFTSGISTCITGAIGDTNTTNATASVMVVNFGYK